MIEQPLSLPRGVTLAKRLCKSAMAEGLASPVRRATPELRRACAPWAAGGAPPQASSNVMIDRRLIARGDNLGQAMARQFA